MKITEFVLKPQVDYDWPALASAMLTTRPAIPADTAETVVKRACQLWELCRDSGPHSLIVTRNNTFSALQQLAKEGLEIAVRDILDWCQAQGYQVSDYLEGVGHRQQTVWHVAARYNQAAVIEMLAPWASYVNTQDWEGNTALHTAAREGHPAAVQALLGLGASRTAINNQLLTPLDQAVGYHQHTALACLLSGIHWPDKPLAISCAIDMAIRVSNRLALQSLLDQGVSPNAPTRRGTPPLFAFVKTDFPNQELLELLLARGADINQTDSLGATLLDYVIQQRHRQLLQPPQVAFLNLALAKGARLGSPQVALRFLDNRLNQLQEVLPALAAQLPTARQLPTPECSQ